MMHFAAKYLARAVFFGGLITGLSFSVVNARADCTEDTGGNCQNHAPCDGGAGRCTDKVPPGSGCSCVTPKAEVPIKGPPSTELVTPVGKSPTLLEPVGKSPTLLEPVGKEVPGGTPEKLR
jgi:hypothetical protein